MLRIFKSSFLLGLLVLAGFSQVHAQESVPTRNREVLVGTTLGAGFNPRIMYKKVNEKSVTRYLLRLNSNAGNSQFNSFTGSTDFGTSRSDFNVDLGLGIGLEWRSEVMAKFQVYYGGDVELMYGYSNATVVNPRFGSTPGVVFKEGANSTEHSPGLGLGAFVGFRYALSDRMSFAVEAGPSLGGRLIFQNSESRRIAGTAPDEFLETKTSNRTGFTANFRIISPVYLQFGVHF